MRLFILVLLSLLAFAGNSLISRIALKTGGIDPASFVTIRIFSAAVPLAILALFSKGGKKLKGNWGSAAFLLLYAIPFTFAYVGLSAATGALISFGAVQLTMICWGLRLGEKLSVLQTGGLFIAFGGLLVLLLPGSTAPGLKDAALMLTAGIAWSFYSLRGRGSSSPSLDTAGNFIRALPLCIIACLPFISTIHLSTEGILLAILSGAITSGLGYIIWYQALKSLSATSAAVVQSTVPIIASFLGIFLLDEALNLRIIIASVMVLVGITVVLLKREKGSKNT